MARNRRKIDRCGQFAADVPSAAQAPSTAKLFVRVAELGKAGETQERRKATLQEIVVLCADAEANRREGDAAQVRAEANKAATGIVVALQSTVPNSANEKRLFDELFELRTKITPSVCESTIKGILQRKGVSGGMTGTLQSGLKNVKITLTG